MVKKLSFKHCEIFLSQNWNPQQIINAINEAYENKIYVSGSKYKGNSQGISIDMYLTPEGKIKSAYPIKEKT
ncbi:MAG: EndoU domain-containing protein [Fibrobacteraceae bacterium]|nr:EndoU domain-containing protein [Fibrobacteraceae bacterium]